MKHLLAGTCCLLVFAAGSGFADELKDASGRIQPLTERMTKIGAGKAADFAKGQLATTQETLGAATAALAVKSGPLTLLTDEKAALTAQIEALKKAPAAPPAAAAAPQAAPPAAAK